MKTAGEIIKEARQAHGYTQENLAELSKMNLRTIQRIENGENLPRSTSLRQICSVLELDIETILQEQDGQTNNYLVSRIVNIIFLIALNIALMAIMGYLLLDTNSNWNTRLAALLLSFFIPAFIVYNTKSIGGLERMLKFGSGFIFYIVFSLVVAGIPHAFMSGLVPILTLALAVLYYGNRLLV